MRNKSFIRGFYILTQTYDNFIKIIPRAKSLGIRGVSRFPLLTFNYILFWQIYPRSYFLVLYPLRDKMSSMVKIIFSENLKQLMKDENINQVQLSQKIGVAQSAISAWLLGKKEPSIKSLWLLADYFNVDIDYLVGREDL